MLSDNTENAVSRTSVAKWGGVAEERIRIYLGWLVRGGSRRSSNKKRPRSGFGGAWVVDRIVATVPCASVLRLQMPLPLGHLLCSPSTLWVEAQPVKVEGPAGHPLSLSDCPVRLASYGKRLGPFRASATRPDPGRSRPRTSDPKLAVHGDPVEGCTLQTRLSLGQITQLIQVTALPVGSVDPLSGEIDEASKVTQPALSPAESPNGDLAGLFECFTDRREKPIHIIGHIRCL